MPKSSDIAPEIKLLSNIIQASIVEQVKTQNRFFQYQRSWCNRPPVIKVARHIFQTMQTTPIPNDNKSGYTLVADCDLKIVLEKILNTDRYKAISLEELDARRLVAKTTLENIASRLSKKYDDKRIQNATMKSFRESYATDIAQMQLRCKTHREAGQVWLRVITGNGAYSYKSLSFWLVHRARHLRNTQGAHQFLVLSGVDYVRR